MPLMLDSSQGRPFGLYALAAAYFFFLFLTVSSYGYPFPFMGKFYPGRAGDCLIFADCMVSLYLFIGILKRQRLTVWLLIAYNLLDICNACVNLALIPPGLYARLAEVPIPEDDLRWNTFAAALFLMLLNFYVYRNRRYFDNRSPYLF
jgi:hypothetical protein